jgi:arsenate reductase
MPATVIYHNPRCSKSRQTLDLLNEHGVDAEIVEYLKTPPDAEILERILDMLGLQPRELMRSNETAYRELGLDDASLSREQLIAAMVEHPKLIQRPIVIRGSKAALGRPPEDVLEIL